MSLHDIVSILLVLKVSRVKSTFLGILLGSGKIDLKIFHILAIHTVPKQPVSLLLHFCLLVYALFNNRILKLYLQK